MHEVLLTLGFGLVTAAILSLSAVAFTLEYAGEYAGADGGLAPAELIRRSRARGFVPYVSTIGLDQVSTHTLAP